MFRISSIYLPLIILVVSLSSCHKRISRPADETKSSDRTLLLIDENKNLRAPIIELMRLTGLDPKSTLSDGVTSTQARWLRPKGSERAHLSEQNHEQAAIMLRHFASVGLVDKVLPKYQTYDYVLILGSMYGGFTRRLAYVEQLVAGGIVFKKLALLGSHRPLERQFEVEPMLRDHIFTKLPLTEIEMMEAMLEKSSLSTQVKSTDIISVASSMKTLKDGTISRADTLDTVEDFFRTNKKSGSVLVISSQPYVLRQHLVVASVLKTPWEIDSVGPAAQEDLPSAVYLDELARTLFELQKSLSSK